MGEGLLWGGVKAHFRSSINTPTLVEKRNSQSADLLADLALRQRSPRLKHDITFSDNQSALGTKQEVANTAKMAKPRRFTWTAPKQDVFLNKHLR